MGDHARRTPASRPAAGSTCTAFRSPGHLGVPGTADRRRSSPPAPRSGPRRTPAGSTGPGFLPARWIEGRTAHDGGEPVRRHRLRGQVGDQGSPHGRRSRPGVASNPVGRARGAVSTSGGAHQAVHGDVVLTVHRRPPAGPAGVTAVGPPGTAPDSMRRPRTGGAASPSAGASTASAYASISGRLTTSGPAWIHVPSGPASNAAVPTRSHRAFPLWAETGWWGEPKPVSSERMAWLPSNVAASSRRGPSASPAAADLPTVPSRSCSYRDELGHVTGDGDEVVVADRFGLPRELRASRR